MLGLILLVVFGLGVSFFATQNTSSVHILFGSYRINEIPLYIIVVGSLLLGVFISWLISLVDSFSSAFTLHGKDSEIKRMSKTIERLHEEMHDLEIENTHLRDVLEPKAEEKAIVENDREEQERSTLKQPSFPHDLRQAIA